MTDWNRRFLDLARHVSTWSKDPSTQVGAVIASPDKRVVSLGFNGFPRGVPDDERLDDRDRKYELIVHAEANAILFARGKTEGASIYLWPLPPCSRCASIIIQAGIACVFAPVPEEERWMDNCVTARRLLLEAGIPSFWVS